MKSENTIRSILPHLLLNKKKIKLYLFSSYGIGGTDEEFIMKHKDRLYHIHLHDACGKKNHLALGTGEIDVKKYLCLAKEQNCRMVLETKTIDGLKESVEWLNKSI